MLVRGVLGLYLLLSCLLCVCCSCVTCVRSDSDVTLGHIPGAPTLTGTGRPDLQDLFSLPEPYCRPFRRMLAHPAVISRLNWMIGAVRSFHNIGVGVL